MKHPTSMKWVAFAVVVLFIGLAFAPSINADVKEKVVEEIPVNTITGLEQQEQRLLKLVDGIISYVERIYGPLPDEDCDCEEQGTTEWPFPIICGLLYPAAILSWVMFYIPMLIFGPNWPGFIGAFFYMIMKNIGTTLNCKWADM